METTPWPASKGDADHQSNLHSRNLEHLLHELDDRKLLLGLVGTLVDDVRAAAVREGVPPDHSDALWHEDCLEVRTAVEQPRADGGKARQHHVRKRATSAEHGGRQALLRGNRNR